MYCSSLIIEFYAGLFCRVILRRCAADFLVLGVQYLFGDLFVSYDAAGLPSVAVRPK